MHNESFDLFCLECNIQVEAPVIAHGSGGFSSNAINPIDEIDAEYHGDVFYVALCRRCNSPFLVKQSLYGVPAEFESITSEETLYPKFSRIPTDGVPDAVLRAYEQALRCFSSSSYDACALMCRRCLEALCRSFDATSGSLQAKLQVLYELQQIDAKLIEWAHGVRAVGNEAAHDTDSELSKEDARDALDFTEALLSFIFVLNKRFEAFKLRREKKPS